MSSSAGLGRLFVSLGLDSVEFTTGITKAESQAAASAKAMERSITAGVLKANLAFEILTNAASAAYDYLNNQAEQLAGFQDLAEKIGDSAIAIASLKAASDVSGVSLDQMASASVKLTTALAKTDEEGKGVAQAVKALGLEFNSFKALAPVDQIEAVAKAMAGFEDGASKTAVAVALFGKSGAELMPFLNDLADGAERHTNLTQDQIKAADDFTKEMGKLKSEISSFTQVMSAEAMPVMLEMVKNVRGFAEFLKSATGQGSFFGDILAYIAEQGKRHNLEMAETLHTVQLLGVAYKNLFGYMKALVTLDGQLFAKLNAGVKKDTDRINESLAAYKRTLDAASSVSAPIATGPSRGQLYEVKKPTLDTSGLSTGTSSGGGKSKRAESDDSGIKYLESLRRQNEQLQSLTQAETLLRDIQAGRLKVANDGQFQQLLDAARLVDITKQQVKEEQTRAQQQANAATYLANLNAQVLQTEKLTALQKVAADIEAGRLAGATEGQIAEIKATAGKIDRLREEGEIKRSLAEADKARADEAQAIRESLKTDMDILFEKEARLVQLYSMGKLSADEYAAAQARIREQLKRVADGQNEVASQAKTSMEALASGMADAIVEGKSLRDVFKQIVKELAKMILKQILFNALKSAVGTVIPGFAAGGSHSGGARIVGENGPELEVTGPSRIYNAAQTKRIISGGGGGSSNVTHINHFQAGVSRAEVYAGMSAAKNNAVSTVRENKMRRRA